MNNDIQQISQLYTEGFFDDMDAANIDYAKKQEAKKKAKGRPPFEPVNKSAHYPENFVDAANQIMSYFELEPDLKMMNALYAAWNASTFFRED